MKHPYVYLLKYLELQVEKLKLHLAKSYGYDALDSVDKEILMRNKNLQNIHKGKRAFVIVNGPSLNKQDISYLNSDITFTVNGFFKHNIVEKWQPTYHCVLDPVFFEEKRNVHDFWTEVTEKIPKSKLLVTLKDGLYYFKKRRYNNESVYFSLNSGLPDTDLDFTNVVQGFQSVSAFALAQAIYMGCNPIYLIGFDHDFLANRGIDTHFYEGCCYNDPIYETVPSSDLNSYLDEMKSVTTLFENYYCLKDIAKRKNIEIYNATAGGYLDVFPRVKYEELFK